MSGSTSEPPKPQPQTSSASSSPSTADTDDASAQRAYGHKLGETVAYTDGVFQYNVTVLEAKEITEATLPEIDGDRFGILVKSCLEEGGPTKFTLFSWSVRAGDGGRYQAQSYQPGAIPGPEYSVSRIGPGSCLKGWIPFEVGDADAITTAVYTPTANQNYGEWALQGSE